jgi:hypothetical protein
MPYDPMLRRRATDSTQYPQHSVANETIDHNGTRHNQVDRRTTGRHRPRSHRANEYADGVAAAMVRSNLGSFCWRMMESRKTAQAEKSMRRDSNARPVVAERPGIVTTPRALTRKVVRCTIA